MRRSDPDVLVIDGVDEVDPLADALAVVDALGPLLTPERALRIDAVVAARTRRLVVVLDHLHDPHNCGAVLRSCDAFGVQDVVAIEATEPFAIARRATRGADKWVDVQKARSAAECLRVLRARGLAFYVADPRGGTGLEELADCFGRGERIALCFGNERDGVDPELRAASQGSFRVPMSGFAESLNVSVAVAISLHAIRRRWASGDLPERERLELRARFYRQAVREADAIVRRLVRR